MKYSKLSDLYQELKSTRKRLEKTQILANFLEKCSPDEAQNTVLLVQGKIYPDWDDREIGVASQLVSRAITVASGATSKQIVSEWKKTGDLGKASKNLLGKKNQMSLASNELTVSKVLTNLRKLNEMTGQGSVDRKIQLIAELYTSASPDEAVFITRTVLADLQVGIGQGTLRDALVWAYLPRVVSINCDEPLEKNLEVNSVDELKNLDKYDSVSSSEKIEREIYNYFIEKVQEAYDVTNDFGVVAKALSESSLKGLEKISLKIGKPVKVMLAQKANTIEEAFETVGKPAEAEYKFDGFRVQIHKDDNKVNIFTRRLENVTNQFPDIVKNVSLVKAKKAILDAEAVGFDPKTKKYLPFQNISQRIKRKYDIETISKQFPVEVNVFDVIYLDGKNLIKEPLKKRREIVEKIVPYEKFKILPAKKLVTSDPVAVKSFFIEAKEQGNEGLMIKSLDAPYKPGSRVGHMLKYKETMENLDLVIIGAEWGEGKRSKWLSSFDIACKNDDVYLEIGKVATGLKEKPEEGLSFMQLTDLLKPLITKEEGKHIFVKPKVIIEVGYEEIQKSPTYNSKFALRFPRVIRLRDDKGLDDVATLEMVKKFFESQRFS